VDGDHTAGGSAALVELIGEVGSALDYDLLRIGIDLGRVFTDEVSPARVLWLIDQLPTSSATKVALARNPALRDWNLTNLLLSGVFNRLGMVAIAAAQPHTRKRLPTPEVIRPPIRQVRRRAGRVIDKLPY
jgi:hypothetical protein